MNKFQTYCLRHDKLNLQYLSEKFDQSLDQTIEKLCKLWDKFDNPHMVGDMLHTSYPKQSWYYEVCDTPYRRGEYVTADQLQTHWLRNQAEDQHISVYAHDRKWKESVDETGSPSCQGTKVQAPIIWVELDRKDYRKRPSFQKAVKDGMALRSRILLECPEAQVWVFTSGNNSTHIAINGSLFGNPIVAQHNTDVFRHLAYLLAQGLRFGIEGNARDMSEQQLRSNLAEAYPEVTLADQPEAEHEFKWDAQTAESALENCDQNIYHTNALIRQPWSWHEKGGNRKTLIDLNGNFKYEPRLLEVKDQQPKLLHLWDKAWEKHNKNKSHKKLDCLYDSDYIVNTYKQYYPDIQYMKPDSKGWVGRFHSIFYNDGNADVTINLKNGFHHDFGSHRYSLTFDEFLLKTRDL